MTTNTTTHALVRTCPGCREPIRTNHDWRLHRTCREPGDATASAVDLASARPLAENRDTAFIGGFKKGPFEIPEDLAREWLELAQNRYGRTNADVLSPWVSGIDLARRPNNRWVIDFGQKMTEAEASSYDAPFEHVRRHVKPFRDLNRRDDLRRNWWRHDPSGKTLFERTSRLPRYIATPAVSKYRLFRWYDPLVYPSHALSVIARHDDITFGILHSRFHEVWSLALGSDLKGVPRYTPTRTFRTFPFPAGLTPDTPACEYTERQHAVAIGDAAGRLVRLREDWLNPPEWIEWGNQLLPRYPRRPVPRNTQAAEAVKRRTLTRLYDIHPRPGWLADTHEALDTAVASAYGWPTDISDEDVLRGLLELNRERRRGGANHP